MLTYPENISLKNMQQELERNTESYTWKPLRIINIYRVFIAVAMSVLFVLLDKEDLLKPNHPHLFFVTGYIYVTFAFIAAIAVIRRFPRFRIQLFSQATVDITVFVLLIYANKSTDGTLAILLVIAVISNCMLMTRRLTVAFASFATIGLLLQQTMALLNKEAQVSSYSFIAVICIAIYITAIAVNTVSRHAREYEALAKKRGIDLNNMEQVNEHIVGRMQFGVIVLDEYESIRLINNAAENILAISGLAQTHVKEVSQQLYQKLKAWKDSGTTSRIPFETPKTSALARFVALGKNSVLVFIEDEAEVTQRIQEAKLASLGQLTASIAHEIRNPLGAISHAGQLLAESVDEDSEEKKLTDIIANHSERLNTIIKSILQLSRRQKVSPDIINLDEWLDKFIYDFSIEQHITTSEIDVHNRLDKDVYVQIDPSHLEQVMWNLCKNAFNHSRENASPKIVININQDDNLINLEIINKGDRITAGVQEKLFEPFFTTRSKGTGLGLYLSREMCSNNGARLQYIEDHPEGTCFRITFAPAPVNVNQEDIADEIV